MLLSHFGDLIWPRLHSEWKIFQFSESLRSLNVVSAQSQRIRSGVVNEQKIFNLFKIQTTF